MHGVTSSLYRDDLAPGVNCGGLYSGGRYSLSLVSELASTRPLTGCLHTHLAASGDGGALHHRHPGVHRDLVVVELGVGVELETWRQWGHVTGFVVQLGRTLQATGTGQCGKTVS